MDAILSWFSSIGNFFVQLWDLLTMPFKYFGMLFGSISQIPGMIASMAVLLPVWVWASIAGIIMLCLTITVIKLIP